MDDIRLVKISKYLSKHLRHDPEGLGLTLAPGGWVSISDLLTACAERRMRISRADLEEVVSRNSKQRFSFDPAGIHIRANQGHSVDVDLQLAPSSPPAILYHGTGHQTASLIMQEGLRKMGRNHVHLSTDTDTAKAVGSRHGRPTIFQIDTVAMEASGHLFYCSDNGVWLTETVPAQFLTLYSP
ncbi:MAG: RNA 2'-phosphotransferase [Janthinobacterium lividum]